MKSRMPERARTDPREPWGSNPLGPPGPELCGLSASWVVVMAGEIKGMVSFLVQQSVGLSAAYRTHRLPAGGGSVVAARCPVCGEPVCLDRSTYQNNYECPLRRLLWRIRPLSSLCSTKTPGPSVLLTPARQRDKSQPVHSEENRVLGLVDNAGVSRDVAIFKESITLKKSDKNGNLRERVTRNS